MKATLESTEKKIEQLKKKLEDLRITIQEKQALEKKIVQEINSLEEKRNSLMFGDLSGFVKEQNISIDKSDIEFLMNAMKKRIAEKGLGKEAAVENDTTKKDDGKNVEPEKEAQSEHHAESETQPQDTSENAEEESNDSTDENEEDAPAVPFNPYK